MTGKSSSAKFHFETILEKVPILFKKIGLFYNWHDFCIMVNENKK